LVQSLVVIALSHGFFDVRMKDVCSPKLFDRLEKMGDKILHVFGVDAVGQGGLVEEYFEDQPSYYCAGENVTGEGGGWVFGWILMWSALDKLQRVAESMHMVDKARGWRNHAAQMREEIFKLGMSADKKHLVSYSGEERVGPSLLRVAELGFLSEKDPVFAATVAEFENQWATSLDGSGVLLSTLLWYGEALRGVGRVKEAQSLFHAVCATSSETGLLTEAVDLKSGTLWGNGPATNAILAFLRLGSRLSRNWRSI
jgi:GH15 family glucan-1,4-alpha-glucosidase